MYLLLVILPLKHLPLLQRIILTSMLYQLRWRNTFMELEWQLCSFHWRKIKLWNKMSYTIWVFLNSSKKLAEDSEKLASWGLWDHKRASIQKKYATFFTSVYNQYRIFELSGLIAWDWIWQRNCLAEIIWFKKLLQSSHHSSNSASNNSNCVPGRHLLMSLINEKVNTQKSQ